MPVIPFIPLISAGVAGGAALGGAKIAANANKHAADVTATQADKDRADQEKIFQAQRQDELQKQADALRLQEQQRADQVAQYEASRKDSAGYRSLGLGALGELAAGTGLGPVSYESAPVMGAPMPREQVPMPPPIFGPETPATMPAQSRQPATLASLSAAPPVQTAAQAQTQSSYVPMRDPKGRNVWIPPDQVREAESRGAQRMA